MKKKVVIQGKGGDESSERGIVRTKNKGQRTESWGIPQAEVHKAKRSSHLTWKQ